MSSFTPGLSSLDVNAPYVLACICGNGCKQVACGELLVTKGLQRLWDHVASGLILLRAGSLRDGLVQVTACVSESQRAHLGLASGKLQCKRPQRVRQKARECSGVLDECPLKFPRLEFCW